MNDNGIDELEETVQELEARHPGIRADMDRMVLVRVLPGPAENHLHLTRHGPNSTQG